MDADVGRGREEEGAEPAVTMGEDDTCARFAELAAGRQNKVLRGKRRKNSLGCQKAGMLF